MQMKDAILKCFSKQKIAFENGEVFQQISNHHHELKCLQFLLLNHYFVRQFNVINCLYTT